MDESAGKSADIEEWMKELLPDVSSEAGMGRGVIPLPPSGVNNSNQQVKPMSLGENYQLPPVMTSNNNPGMWQHSQRTLDFSQNQASRNMASKLHQQPQQLQNQVLGQGVERPNMYQFRLPSNMYPNNIRQHQQTSLGGYATSHMMKHQEAFNVVQQTDQATLQKTLEAQRGFVSDSMHPKLQIPGFHQPQNLALVNQMKPGNQPQPMQHGRSPDSTPQVEVANSIDWVNQGFQKLRQMRETYLSDVIKLFNKAKEDKSRATNNEMMVRFEKRMNVAEKLYGLLTQSKSDLLNWRKEKFCHMMEEALKQLVQIKAMMSPVKQTQQAEASGSHLETPQQMQQRENYFQFNCAPTNINQSMRQGAALNLPESLMNLSKVGLSGEYKVDSSSVMNTSKYSPMRAAQKWASPGNMLLSPPQKGSQMGFDQRSLRMLLHPSDGVAQHTNFATPQQAVTSSRNIFNSLDYSVNPMSACLQQTSMSPSLQSKQQDQAMKRQKMKQPVQQLLSDKNKQQMLQKRNEDANLRRFVGFNQKMSPMPPASPYAASPQNSQQSSSPLEQKDLSTKLSKSGTSQLSTSPSAFPSPYTPLTPSSTPMDYARTPLSLEESSKLQKTSAAQPQIPVQDTNQNQLATESQGLAKSGLQTDSSCPDMKSSCTKGDPMKRLVDAVKSVSSGALNASLHDICAVTNLTDRMAGFPLHGEPTRFISRDLADDISNHETFILAHQTGMKSKTKRHLETLILNYLSSEDGDCSHGDTKRLKNEPNDLLFQEINDVNRKLIEVVVDVMDLKDGKKTGGNEGTLIRCSYVPVGCPGNTEMQSTTEHKFPNLVLEVMVTDDYPDSPPTVSETIPPCCRDADQKNLWLKAKSKLSSLLRQLPQPMSVKDVAMAWDACARETFHEFAKQTGGGSFTTAYGKWESCVLAT